MNPIITSMLDDDLYKVSMAQAVIQKFPQTLAEYTFINRGAHQFSSDFYDRLQQQIYCLRDLALNKREAEFLKSACPALTPPFIEWLASYRYNPDEVLIGKLHDGRLGLTIRGPWYRTILWEVKLMAIISELKMAEDFQSAYDRNVARAFDNTRRKAFVLDERGICISDFGTRRRFSAKHHEQVVKILHESGACLAGTSNMHLAHKFGLPVVGTQAHEWFMFHGAVFGYRQANYKALENWADVYRGQLGIALTDTFTTAAFFKEFDTQHAKLYDGLRQDSGNPIDFFNAAHKAYKKLGVNPQNKTIIFSDALTTEKIINIHETVSPWMLCAFGVGTHLTNDIPDVTPMNMVIKMSACSSDGSAWLPVVKLSDDSGKHTGSTEEVSRCKTELGLE